MQEKLSPIDRKILRLLQHDADLSAAEIAEKVELSQSPCWRRINRMQEEGLIERKVALLNPKQLGLGMTVFVYNWRLKEAGKKIDSAGPLYGVALPADATEASIAELISARVGGRAEVGDRVALGSIELIVRDVDEDGQTTACGLTIVEDDRGRISTAGSWRKVLEALGRRAG